MSKLSIQEEKELVSFIKDWLKSHGFTQKDLANELNIKSSRTSEIILKMKLYKKGGMFNIAKNLIKIEQKWLNNIKNDYPEEKQTPPYNQLDIDSLVNQINQDTNE
jgi:predicted XRE-type DNA-binding protein